MKSLLFASLLAAGLTLGSVRAGNPVPAEFLPVSAARVDGEPDPDAALQPGREAIAGYPVLAGTRRELTAQQGKLITTQLADEASYSAGKTRCLFKPGMAVRLQGPEGETKDVLVCFACSEVAFASGGVLGEKSVMSADLRAALLAAAHALWPDDGAIQSIAE